LHWDALVDVTNQRHASATLYFKMTWSMPMVKRITNWVLNAVSASALCGVYGAEAVVLDEPIKPIPLTIPMNAEKVELGKSLFADKRFAKDNSVS
jgi:cytochrome c peroxidase